MKTYVYKSTLKRINDKDPFSQTCILYIYIYFQRNCPHSCHSGCSRSSCILFILLVIRIIQIYERHNMCCVEERAGLANVFWETINQRSSVSEGETAVSVRCERDRGTRILYTSASIHRTKQNKNDRFPFYFMYIICIHVLYYYVIERDDPLSLCKHAYTVYLRKDLYT